MNPFPGYKEWVLLMSFLCFGVDRLFVYGDLFKSSILFGMDSKSSLTRVQGVLLVLFLCGPGQALHMCFGIDLSTRVTTNKARGTFRLPVLLLLVRSKGLRGSPFLISIRGWSWTYYYWIILVVQLHKRFFLERLFLRWLEREVPDGGDPLLQRNILPH